MYAVIFIVDCYQNTSMTFHSNITAAVYCVFPLFADSETLDLRNWLFDQGIIDNRC